MASRPRSLNQYVSRGENSVDSLHLDADLCAGVRRDVVTTIHDQINVRDQRREQRLKKMKERQFDQPTLHQLFRVFDSTNSHVLSLSDFQTGLIAMGFSEAEGVEKGSFLVWTCEVFCDKILFIFFRY